MSHLAMRTSVQHNISTQPLARRASGAPPSALASATAARLPADAGRAAGATHRLHGYQRPDFMGAALLPPNRGAAVGAHRGRAPLVCQALDPAACQALLAEGVQKAQQLHQALDPVACQALLAEGAQKAQQVQQAFDPVSTLLVPGLMAGAVFLLFRRSAGGGAGLNGPMAFGKVRSEVMEHAKTGVTFADVAGIDEAKTELQEIVDFLKDPTRYKELGASICKGVLLEGPPGTGKTLLAKAIAGEADVPFIQTSGPEFVEMFVGVGSSRVRDLFAKAKANAPCIVFIDEIDGVARKRGGGMPSGASSEADQTLIQLLTEMDGFEESTNVIVVAATNRPETLDDAILRPGRFDRRVTVPLPEKAGRVAILQVHAKGKKIGPDVDFENVAARTVGFSGAELANLLNEAAILAVKRDLKQISAREISDAYERKVGGIERPNAAGSQEKRRLVAYHEAGHAVLGAVVGDYDVCESVSILPRGGAAGLTFFKPDARRLDDGIFTRQYLLNRNVVALGGRVAEELIFGDDGVTTGAGGDLEQVRENSKLMVTRYGWGEGLAPMAALGVGNGSPFGVDGASEWYMKKVDVAVEALAESSYVRAKELMQQHEDKLHAVAQALLEKEKITGEELLAIIGQAAHPAVTAHLTKD